MKKVLVINIGTDIGGIEKSLIDFLTFLAQSEYEVDLALWKKPGALFQEIPSNIHILDRLGVGSFTEIRCMRGIRKISQLLKYGWFKFVQLFGNEYKVLPKLKTKYDIAISFTQDGYSPYYIIDKVEADKKYMWYHHGSYEKTEKEKKQDEKYYQKFDKVITVSNANKTMLKEYFPNVQLEVIANLIHKERIYQLSQGAVDVFAEFKGLKIVTVGRIAKEKGQLFSVEVAKQLKENNVDFLWVFVGAGNEKETCERLALECGLQDKCLFVGAKENPYPYMKQADIYVQASLVESECITAKEAILLNKKIIASDIPALRETLSNGEYGLLCPLDPQIFAMEIERYVLEKSTISFCGAEVIEQGNKNIMKKLAQLLE